jgi:threonine/homoserine/homoserine lactone efflux protein
MRGQAAMVGIMLGFMVFITIVILIEPLKDQIDIARDPSHLDCANTSLSTMGEMSCIITDAQLFIFVGMGFAVAWAWMSLRNLRQGAE